MLPWLQITACQEGKTNSVCPLCKKMFLPHLVRLSHSLNCLPWLHDCVNSSLYSYFQVQSTFHYPDITQDFDYFHCFFLITAMILHYHMFYSSHGQFRLQLQSTMLQALGNQLTRGDCFAFSDTLFTNQSVTSLQQRIKPPPQSPLLTW